MLLDIIFGLLLSVNACDLVQKSPLTYLTVSAAQASEFYAPATEAAFAGAEEQQALLAGKAAGEPGVKERLSATVRPSLAYSLGYDHYIIGDYAKARPYWETAAAKNYAEAQYGLGLMYHLGLGVDVDYTKAHAWYEKAAANGSHEAEQGLGLLYMNGFGVPQNYLKALAYYKAAAENGMPDAQYSLAFMYYNGMGVDRDFDKAFQWFDKVAQTGHLRAITAQGIMYLHGLGTPKDYVKARELLQAVADYEGPSEPWQQPIVEAQFNLGRIYHEGLGLDKPDLARALLYYLDARQAGDLQPLNFMLQIIEQQTPTELAAIAWRLGELYEARPGAEAATEAYTWYLVAREGDYPGAAVKLQRLGGRISEVQQDTAAIKCETYLILLQRYSQWE